MFHWSQAETTQLESGRDSARARHGGGADRTPDLEWIDLFKIMGEDPIAVRGALAFGLNPMAKAIRGLGLIETDWGGQSGGWVWRDGGRVELSEGGAR